MIPHRLYCIFLVHFLCFLLQARKPHSYKTRDTVLQSQLKGYPSPSILVKSAITVVKLAYSVCEEQKLLVIYDEGLYIMFINVPS